MTQDRFTRDNSPALTLLPAALLALAAAAGAEPTTTAPARAEPAAAFEEIVVTARRREESLQNVSIAVTALDQAALQSKGIDTVSDLQYAVPATTLYGTYRDSPILSLRCPGGNSPARSPSGAIYLNEVPMPTSAQAGSAGGVL